MPRSIRVNLIVEDIGHEYFVKALVQRIAKEAGHAADLGVLAGRGGRGRAIRELRVYQQALIRDGRVGDLLIVVIDANCTGWNVAREEIEQTIRKDVFPRYVIGCPDPHVERWYLADPTALHGALEINVAPPRKKCERDVYKNALQDALLDAGYETPLGGAEYAADIVLAMDLYRAGKADSSLRTFIADVRSALRA